ncbi:MAG: TolC family protein, partial [Bacteroidales bacterium]|nr:TolC family protein [Bacteroidales bacterium]
DEGGGGGMSSMMSGILDPIMYYINELYKGTGVPFVPYVPAPATTDDSNDGGIAVGRWNTFNAGITATMPLINAQLWQSLAISGESVDLAVEKARSSRLEMVNQVKQAYYAALLAKEANHVYKSVYDNAVQNLELTQKKYNASKASELDLARAKTTVANAVPNLFNSENSIYLSLWQLKAIMGIDLEAEIDVKDSLLVYSEGMSSVLNDSELSLSGNSTLRQLEIQADQLANTVKMQQYAYLPTLSLAFSYSLNAMTNDFKFEEYHWTPYSYVGLSLSIPIFSGGQRLNDLRQTRVQANQLSIQRENTERQLRIAIRQSLSTMETAVKSHESALDALESAQKAYDIAAKSYEIGRSTLTDLDAAQLALTQAQLAASQAIYNYLVAKAGLESTIGADYTAENTTK